MSIISHSPLQTTPQKEIAMIFTNLSPASTLAPRTLSLPPDCSSSSFDQDESITPTDVKKAQCRKRSVSFNIHRNQAFEDPWRQGTQDCTSTWYQKQDLRAFKQHCRDLIKETRGAHDDLKKISTPKTPLLMFHLIESLREFR